MNEGSQNSYARFAGLMYFFTAFDIAGVVIVSRISGNGTFLDTAHSVAALETLYRIGLLCGLVGNLSTILLAVGLYVALKPVDGNLAMAALLFRLAESAIGGVVVVFGFASLQIYLDANHGTPMDSNQLGELANLVSHTSAAGTEVSVTFFCVGSAIFFYLFLKSAYIPRILATWGLLASVFCLIAFVGSLLVPRDSELLTGIGGLPIGVAEPVVGLWLLIRGINTHSRLARAVGSSLGQ